MSTAQPLRKLLGLAEYELEIRKSRFLARAVPLANAEEAADWLQRLSEPAASHNCWAWRFGEQYRFSDDGEPGGTAGRPILAAIENRGFDQCLVLVTRWYGGIQLGTGGLARAYGGCANSCLQEAPSEALVARVLARCECGYPVLEQFKNLLNAADACIMEEHYLAQGVQLQLALPQSQLAQLQQALQNLSRGESQLVCL